MAMMHGGISGEDFNFSIMMHGTQDHRKPTNNNNCSYYCLFMGHTVFSVYHSLQLTEGDDVLWKLVSFSQGKVPAGSAQTNEDSTFIHYCCILFKLMTYFTF